MVEVVCKFHLVFFSTITDIFNFRNWMAYGWYWEFPYSRVKHNFDYIWLMVNNVEEKLGPELLRNVLIGEKM
jgi:hypothetical protein